MKKLLPILSLLLLSVLPSQAAANYYFSGTGNQAGLNTSGNGTAAISSLIVSGRYGTPRVQYINATCDNATNNIYFYKASVPASLTATAASGQAVVTCVPTGITNSVLCVLWHVSSDTYEKLTTSSCTSSNITFTGNLSAAAAIGDVVYLETISGVVPVGAATKEINAQGGASWNGQSRLPLLISAIGTTAATINGCSGVYDVNTP